MRRIISLIANRNAKHVAILVGVVATTVLSGCASIVNGTSQPISVTTPPVSGATCSLKNSKGEWYVNATPGSAVVHRAYGPLTVNCKKSGYNTAIMTVKSSTKGMAFGNVVFGGIIGGGVDMADGAAYDYPTPIVVPMSPVTAQNPAPQASPVAKTVVSSSPNTVQPPN